MEADSRDQREFPEGNNYLPSFLHLSSTEGNSQCLLNEWTNVRINLKIFYKPLPIDKSDSVSKALFSSLKF